MEDNLITIEQAINDPKYQAESLNSARHIFENVSKNWFTAFDLSNKLRIGFSDSVNKLNTLKLFGVIHEREGKKPSDPLQYKVVFTKDQKARLIQDDIKFYEQKIVILKKQLEKMKISTSSQKGDQE